jgi:Nif11 domain
MSIDRTKAFVQFLAYDPDLRTRLLSATPDQRQALMEQAGYGDVDGQTVADLLQSDAGDLSDEQLKSIQGGLTHAGITWD